MERLSDLDASFIYLESERTHMHIGGLYLFEGTTEWGPFTYQQFHQHIEARLHLSPIFRRRLIQAPLNLDHPSWVDDPDFVLDLHVPRRGVPECRDWEELIDLVSDIFSRPLDRSRPLWEITYIDGLSNVKNLPDNCFALLVKVHHSVLDGVAGEEIISALLDMEATPKRIEPADTWQPEPLPGDLEIISRTFSNSLRSPVRTMKFLREWGRGATQSIVERMSSKKKTPPRFLSAPYCILDQPVDARRNFDGTEISLQRITNIKNSIPNATVNDVALTICAGALRDYLITHQALPTEPLVTLAPISVRGKRKQKNGDAAAGNRISGMLVSLATDLSDPLDRLHAIINSVRGSRSYNNAIGAENLTRNMPAATFALASRLYTQKLLSQKHRPFFNVVTTNVPGPQVPLYLDGAELLSQYGLGPIFDGVGVIFVIMSYAGRVSISVTSCPKLLPDPSYMVSLIEKSVDDLELALEELKQAEASPVEKTREKRQAQPSEESYAPIEEGQEEGLEAELEAG